MQLKSIVLAALTSASLSGAALAQEDQTPPSPSMAPAMMGCGMMGGMMHGPMMGMMSRHTEGYLAFLKAELAITPDQEKAWDAFAGMIRDRAAKMRSAHPAGSGMMMGGMMGRGMGQGMMMDRQTQQIPPLTETLDRQVERARSHLDALKAFRDTAKPLYQSLSADQQAKANILLGCPMGM